MAKYDPLGDFLGKRRGGACTLSHANIEEILGEPLPPSAKRGRGSHRSGGDRPHAERTAV
ncbi:MAG: hypothetical protein F4029_19080 [Gammaproteobacteria bacterium]|nr:hypothetical protein [Gammaproteobacteria bacterium]MYF29098.1 hypothetical protein [Gammaproteobacteria bacterium]MYK48319.1 hypothetical protein [Gammaproteobacteria bacterium]